MNIVDAVKYRGRAEEADCPEARAESLQTTTSAQLEGRKHSDVNSITLPPVCEYQKATHKELAKIRKVNKVLAEKQKL